MLGFFKGKSKDNIIYSPCKGKVVPITEVSDPTFSEKVLGDGFAVIPSEGKIYAPADGEASCGSTAYMWYPYGYRLYAVSRSYAGWRYSGRS